MGDEEGEGRGWGWAKGKRKLRNKKSGCSFSVVTKD